MKKIFLILFVLVFSNAFSQSIKDKTVLGNFVLGVDSFKTCMDDNNISAFQVYEVTDEVADIKKVTLNEARYNGANCRIILLFVNDLLYGVRYYPSPVNYTQEMKNLKQSYANAEIDGKEFWKEFNLLNNEMYRYDKKLKAYKSYLDKRFNIMQTMGDNEEWLQDYFNSDIEITFDVDGNFDESFVHYSTKLAKQYPQYKNF
jgi:hypothetical protein